MASTTSNRRTGRPSRLSDPEFVQRVAECLVAGMSREEMCVALGVGEKKTITTWKKDPRVQLAARKLVKERVVEITRKTDSEIARRLQAPDELTVKEILEIRKEFLGGQLRDQTTELDEATVNEALDFFERDPTAAEQLRKLLAGGGAVSPVPSQE